MSHHHFSARKMADIETLLPGFKAVWPAMKAACGTSQRCPKSVTFTDVASPAYPNDYDCCKRFALDLRDMTLSAPLHVSCGEWAVHAGSNNDGAVSEVPGTHAMITCTYNDHHRTFSMTVQVASLPAQLAERAAPDAATVRRVYDEAMARS
jgi:hypothetical protein